MAVAAARALTNQRCLLRRHRRAFAGAQPGPAHPCARHHADLRVGHHRHQARRAAALDWRPRALRNGARPPSRCPRCFAYWLQGGRISVGFLGGAQIDRFANINSSVIGPYAQPKVRLPGGGGAPEIASLCRQTYVVMAQTPPLLR